jgi:hypothetical protein
MKTASNRVLGALTIVATAIATGACQPSLTFDEIGHGKLGPAAPGDVLSTGTACAINDSGTVAFAALDALSQGSVFVGDGGPLTELGLGSNGLTMPDLVGIDAAGDVAFHSTRDDGASHLVFGVYAIPLGASAPAILIEETPILKPPAHPTTLALSPNGTVATTTTSNGQGAVLRGPIAGPLTALDDGALIFNVKDVAVNDAGVVAVSAEHADPLQLLRGILLLSSPGQTLAQTLGAVDQLPIGEQPSVSINASGDVAFALDHDVTLMFVDPPLTGTTPAGQQTVTAGVYVSHPTPVGMPFDLTPIASLADGFASFGRVLVDDGGRVVFEATRTDGTRGIFSGRSPAIVTIVVENDSSSGPGPLQSLNLGGFNNHGQAVFHGVNVNNGLDQIWRVSGI